MKLPRAGNPSLRFRMASRAQELALKKVFHIIRLHFYLRFYQPEPSYSTGKQSNKEEHQKQRNKIIVKMMLMHKESIEKREETTG